jgi:hypothetical protein
VSPGHTTIVSSVVFGEIIIIIIIKSFYFPHREKGDKTPV